MNKEQLIKRVKSMGYAHTTNERYLYKELGNGYITSIQWHGDNINPVIIALHVDELNPRDNDPLYADYSKEITNHKRLKNIPKGIKVNQRYMCLPNGTSYPMRYADIALETLENRLK